MRGSRTGTTDSDNTSREVRPAGLQGGPQTLVSYLAPPFAKQSACRVGPFGEPQVRIRFYLDPARLKLILRSSKMGAREN